LVIADEFRTHNYYNTMTKMIPELSEAKPGELQSERWETNIFEIKS